MFGGFIEGNIGTPGEVRETRGGPVCGFSVASNYRRGDEEHTTWVRLSLWGKRGETLAPMLTKGKRVLVQCRDIYAREYQGKTYLEADAVDVRFLDKREQRDERSAAPAPARAGGGDDIPL